MDYVTQFETMLTEQLRQRSLEQARQLLDAYPATRMPYTQTIYRCINLLRQAQHPFTASSPAAGSFRLLFYKTDNFILNYILQQFADYFSSHHCTIFYFDKNELETSTRRLFDFLKQGCDAAFFFNNVGLRQTFSDGTSLWEQLSIPCYDFLVDHPMYYSDSLHALPADTTIICADETHTEYLRRFYKGACHTLFLPTAGACASSEAIDFTWANRPIDVLFIGSYKYNAGYSHDELDNFVFNYLQSHTNETFEAAVTQYAEIQQKKSPSDHTDTDDICSLRQMIESHCCLETNLTSSYRLKIMQQLLHAGITIEVYGNGWEQTALTDSPLFHLHAPISFEEGIQRMQQAKIVLNHMAWFKKGSSERIFNAMQAGALCATDSSQYLDSILKNGENCILYSLEAILADSKNAAPNALLPQLLIPLLQNPKAAQTIAQNGHRIASEHTWQMHLSNLFPFSSAH